MNTTLQYEYTDDLRVSDPDNSAPQDPAIAALPDGSGYAMVWQNYHDEYGPEIRFKTINPDGTLLGNEFVVNWNGTDMGAPAIVVTPKFSAVAYICDGKDGLELRVSMFDTVTGEPVSSERVTQDLAPNARPAIAFLNSGDLVIGWTGADANIHTVQYDSNGQVYPDSEYVIEVDGGATDPGLMAASYGSDYLVSYGTTTGNLYTVMITPEFEADAGLGQKTFLSASPSPTAEIAGYGNASLEGTVYSSMTKLADNTYVVVWTEPNTVYNASIADFEERGFNVRIQHLNEYGELFGQTEMANTVRDINNLDPQVTALGDGGYVIVWRADANRDGNIVARRYDAHGNAVDQNEFVLNQDQAGFQKTPAVAAQLAGSGFAAIWAEDGRDDDTGVTPPGIEASIEYNQVTVFSNSETRTDAVSGGPEVSLNTLLAVDDADWNQQLQWSEVSDKKPAHGTLTFTNASAMSGSEPGITPQGSITYKAEPNFTGTDTFTVRVYDGYRTVYREITVNVTAPAGTGNPAPGDNGAGDNVAPGTPVLSPAYDSGAKDGVITNAGAVSYSGTAGAMAGSTMTETQIFIDADGNGHFDSETETGTSALNVDGNYSGGFSIGHLKDGTYTVTAKNNWAGGENYLSTTTLTIDRLSPTMASFGAQDFDLSAGPMTITVTYADIGSGIDPLTIGGQNLRVTNAVTGTRLLVDVKNVDGNTVTYTATPQDGSWDAADAGSYSYEVLAGEPGVHDLAGNALVGFGLIGPSVQATYTPAGGGSTTDNVAPGTPELAADYDSGIKDGITNSYSVKYSGSAGTMAGSGMTNTKVYVDVNGNGRRDEGEPGTFADNVDGKWTGSFDLGSLADGAYTVYAENNWNGGEAYRSQTTLTIDRKGPVVQEMGAPDFDLSTGTMTITVTYDDSGSGIDPLTVNGSNLFVWKPDAGVILFAEVKNISGNTVTYTAAPPGGTWTPAYAGTYKFEVIHGPRGVQDLAGNWMTGSNEVSQPVQATYTPDSTGTGDNVAPGTPELASDSDSGIKDGIVTNADSVNYSGSVGHMAAGEMRNTMVFVDLDGDRAWDEGEPGAFAANIDGQWSGDIDVSGLEDGVYTVYAQNNYAGGKDYQSQTTLTIDRKGPAASVAQASDFHVRSGLSFSIAYEETGSGIDLASIDAGNVQVLNERTLARLNVEVTGRIGNTVIYTATLPEGSLGQDWGGSYGIYVNGGADGVRDLAGNELSFVPKEKLVNGIHTEAPQLGGMFAVNSIDDEHTTKPFSGVTVSDADSDQVSVRIVYEGANGSLSGDGLEGRNGDYILEAPDLATLQQRLQNLVFTPAPIASAAEGAVRTSFTLTPIDGDGPGTSNSLTEVIVSNATPQEQPTPPAEPGDTVTRGTVDGVAVETSTSSGANGVVNNVTNVPVIVTSRTDDPATAHATLADIPLGVSGAGGVSTSLTVSLPTGAGLHVESANTLLSNQQALLDLIARIEGKTATGSDVQTRLTGQGGDFLGKLGEAVLLQTATLTLAANAESHKILITGSSTSPVNGGANASAIGLVIDATQLPSSAVLQLDNVDFAAIVGGATLRGGDGQNYVVGDDASQNILLGADDDVLAGGGGNDVVGSAGGNDRIDGGSGDDIVVGGIGNDTLWGGSGNDVVQGGRSDQGAWNFLVGADGSVSANHELAVFAPGTREDVAASELDLANADLSFASADSARLVDLALLYQTAFGRAPDLSGINFWAVNPIDVKDVAAHMLASGEWKANGGAELSDTAFVQKLYAQAHGRAAEDAGLAFWVGKLDASAGSPALSRAEVLTAIAFSAEHREHAPADDGSITVGSGTLGLESGWFADSGDDVLDGGAGNDLLVGGDGDDTVVYGGNMDGYKFVLGSAGQMHVEDKANGDLDTIVGIETAQFADGDADLAFALAPAAQLKTLGMLYQAVLDRNADLGGFNWWAAKDLDKAALVSAFIGADEYKARYDGMDDAAFVDALYQAAGLEADAANGAASWEAYLSTHTRAELIGAWVSNDEVIAAETGSNGLWLV